MLMLALVIALGTGVAVTLDTYKAGNDPSSNFVGIATASSPTQSLNYATTNSSIPSLIASE